MNILIIDDEQDIGEILRRVLMDEGHLVELAFDGRKGLDLIQAHSYDLIFLDINMPEMTGLELVKYIKKGRSKTKVVIISGYDVMEEFLAQSIGADDYIKKPFKFSEIDAVIEKYKKISLAS